MAVVLDDLDGVGVHAGQIGKQLFAAIQRLGYFKGSAQPTFGVDPGNATNGAYTDGNAIVLAPNLARAVTAPKPGGRLTKFVEEFMTHELAHTQQDPRLLNAYGDGAGPSIEAGAQGFAETMAPRAYAEAGLNHPAAAPDARHHDYGRETAAISTLPQFYMHDQFKKGAAPSDWARFIASNALTPAQRLARQLVQRRVK